MKLQEEIKHYFEQNTQVEDCDDHSYLLQLTSNAGLMVQRIFDGFDYLTEAFGCSFS